MANVLRCNIGQQLVKPADGLLRQAGNIAAVLHANEELPARVIDKRDQFCRQGIRVGKVSLELVAALFTARQDGEQLVLVH